jgi:sugar lactone lactonase YvrE
MYYVDTPTRRIDAFDFDDRTGAISRRRTFIDLAGADGLPDGLTVDADGNVWVAMWGGGSVYCYDPAGQLAGSIDVPVTQVSSVAFGGLDLRDLFITSARTGLSHAQLRREPRAGALFWCRPGVVGRPANLFGG